MSCTLLAADRSDGEENMSSDEAKSPVPSEQNTSCEKSGSSSFSGYTSDTPTEVEKGKLNMDLA
jgi:hypothetical protein